MLDRTPKTRGSKTKVKAVRPPARARHRKDSAGPLERAVLSRETESWDAFRRQGDDAGGELDVDGKGIAEQETAKDLARLRLVSLDALKESGLSIQRAAAKLALARAIDACKGLAAAVRNGAPVVITIDVADPAELNLVEECWTDVIFGAKTPPVSDLETAKFVGASQIHAVYLFAKEPAKARLAEKRRAAALAALASARPVITFSPLAQSHLPDVLLKSGGVIRLTVVPPDARMIRDILRIVIGETTDDLLEPEARGVDWARRTGHRDPPRPHRLRVHVGAAPSCVRQGAKCGRARPHARPDVRHGRGGRLGKIVRTRCKFA